VTAGAPHPDGGHSVPAIVPVELRERPQWVAWKLVPNPGAKKPRKVPIDPRTGIEANPTDPGTWGDPGTAVAAVARYGLAGIGYVFDANDPFSGVDLDDCRNPQTGEIAPWARTIIAALDSYTEVSPSGTGVKIWVRAKLPPNARHNAAYHGGRVEMYDSGRYFTVTAEHVPTTPTTTEDRQSELATLYTNVFGKIESAPAAGAVAGEAIRQGQRTPVLSSLIGKLRSQGVPEDGILSAALALNRTFSPPHPEEKIRKMVADMTQLYPPPPPPPQPAEVESFLNDTRPRIRLRGDGKLLSDVATELGPRLSAVLYKHNGEVVECQNGLLHPVAAQRFRTLSERSVVFYKVHSVNKAIINVGVTLDESDARGILVAPQFLERLNLIAHVNNVRLPVLRSNGNVELLPEGYDSKTATLTDAQVSYSEGMPFADAMAVIRDLFSEFQFSDGERSRSVAISALLGLYCKQLIQSGELRPAFTITKNAEGSGATMCAACAIVPVLGSLPTGVKSGNDEEMRKQITTTIRCGRDVLFLDNLKGQLNSPSLEAFVSAATWTDRLLGGNEVVSGANVVTVVVTANGLGITPDWRRRSLFIELHLSQEHAEDKVFARPLSEPVLKAMRPQILAACWSMVKHWDEAGRPQPSRSHSAFPAWASTVGGIVEGAGFACPFDPAKIAIVADEDGQDMRTLVAEMIPAHPYTSKELIDLCRKLDIFTGLIGSKDAEMGRTERSAFGKLLARYNDRTVADFRFSIDGTGHAKRFTAKPRGPIHWYDTIVEL